jgi:Luciferase-like monooxygenase
MEESRKSGIALRPAVFSPDEIVKLAKVIDQSSVTNIFVPDIPGGFDSIEVCCASLGVSKGIRVGSGVVRLLEHDTSQMIRRLETIQSLSGNRFVLGFGAGYPGADPGKTIESMIAKLDGLKRGFSTGSESVGIKFPQTFAATLRSGIARRSSDAADGFLLNFCSARHAANLVKNVSDSGNAKGKEFACYMKVFYSKSIETAKKIMIDEFAKYNSLFWYHKMFEEDGVAEDIAKASESMRNSSSPIRVPDSLLEISPVNPTVDELSAYVEKYRKAGISIPCIYPYFSSDDKDYEYRLGIIRDVISALEKSG